MKALENLGRAGEAEAYLRDLIAAKHPGWYENALMELLIRQGRFDDAIEAVKHTFDDLYDGNLLQATMILLAEQASTTRQSNSRKDAAPNSSPRTRRFGSGPTGGG
ncbi:hypothetical protein ACFZDP_14300 [Streptomyces mirabilis]|uniref:hypothetical protein n=1 Tax=Streptomyces mirabilis TaxID=68239 RepID=UPI0036ED3146